MVASGLTLLSLFTLISFYLLSAQTTRSAQAFKPGLSILFESVLIRTQVYLRSRQHIERALKQTNKQANSVYHPHPIRALSGKNYQQQQKPFTLLRFVFKEPQGRFIVILSIRSRILRSITLIWTRSMHLFFCTGCLMTKLHLI